MQLGFLVLVYAKGVSSAVDDDLERCPKDLQAFEKACAKLFAFLASCNFLCTSV